jgi:uncharacterized membrane protein YheB (UPF0754 family)
MNTTWLIWFALPFIGALIGRGTNRLAVKMLFHPRRERRFFGLRWQGLIPRRHQEIARQAGEIVQRDLLSSHVLTAEVAKVDLGPYLDEMSTRLVWDRLGPKLRRIPVLGNFVKDRLLAQIHVLARQEMGREAGPMLHKFAGEAEQHLDIQRLVEERVAAFELEQLEAIVNRLAGQEFRQIEILGGVLGFIIGLVQVLFLWLAQA